MDWADKKAQEHLSNWGEDVTHLRIPYLEQLLAQALRDADETGYKRGWKDGNNSLPVRKP